MQGIRILAYKKQLFTGNEKKLNKRTVEGWAISQKASKNCFHNKTSFQVHAHQPNHNNFVKAYKKVNDWLYLLISNLIWL